MCGRFGFIYIENREGRANWYRLIDDEGPAYKDRQGKVELKSRYDIRPTQMVPVIHSDEKGRHILEEMRWGFQPVWSKSSIINTQIEHTFTSKMWKKIIPVQRCLIPASFYYEWQETAGKKTPFSIRKSNQKDFLFAGLWQSEFYKKTGFNENHFSIITQAANDKMRQIHNSGANKFRQPVILDDDLAEKWLNPDIKEEREILSMVRIYQSEEIEAQALLKIGNDVDSTAPVPA